MGIRGDVPAEAERQSQVGLNLPRVLGEKTIAASRIEIIALLRLAGQWVIRQTRFRICIVLHQVQEIVELEDRQRIAPRTESQVISVPAVVPKFDIVQSMHP